MGGKFENERDSFISIDKLVGLIISTKDILSGGFISD